MFALNTKKQNKQEVQEKSLAKQGGKALGGWGNWDPFAFSLTPRKWIGRLGAFSVTGPAILVFGSPQSR